MRHLLGTILLLSASCPTAAAAQVAGAVYDTVIRGGTIVDGSGMAPYKGDVAIKGGHIVAVGRLGRARAATTIDADGLVVAPGFINIHSHSRPDAVATAVNMLTQGVTTDITNADGHGTTDIAKQLAEFTTKGLAENVGLYIGFNAAWVETMGNEDRRASADEIARMRRLLDGNLARGAWGVAAGLDYKPGYYAEADEVVQIASVARPWRTNFPNHDRLRPEEGYSSYKAMAETISISEQAGLVPVITHMKSQGHEQGNAPAVIAMMDRATARGTYTATDLYPYLAGHSGLASLIVPGWALEGGREAMLKRFVDAPTRARIIAEAEKAMTLRFGGPGGVRVLDTGQELTDAMKEMGVGPGEAVLRLLEKEGYAAILTFGREDDVVAFLKYRNSAVSCDCGATLATKVHPRNWGTFPRVLGHYVRDTGALTLTDAVRKMTALPATIIGMNDRGYLAPGMSADVAVFDPKTIRDHATYGEPTKPSEGIRHVFVNGRLALREGRPTGMQGGAIVLRSRHMPSRPMTATNRRRSMTGSGTVSNYDLSFAITQPPGARYARGTLRLTDRGSGVTWVADRMGTIQTAPGWASMTATLRDPRGTLRFATLTVDRASGSTVPAGSASANRPVLVLSLDGEPELTGSANGQVRIAAR